VWGGGGGPAGPPRVGAPAPPPTAPSTASEVLSQRLEHWVQAEPKEVLAHWRERDALLGREIEWEGGSGVADGVDDRGYLVVVAPGGDRIALGAGEVHLTRF
jgi:BirA family biotin operon repressor/biotin-[acetyl-CoA-carboxylase] ligase